jgi:hypothetical protein
MGWSRANHIESVDRDGAVMREPDCFKKALAKLNTAGSSPGEAPKSPVQLDAEIAEALANKS